MIFLIFLYYFLSYPLVSQLVSKRSINKQNIILMPFPSATTDPMKELSVILESPFTLKCSSPAAVRGWIAHFVNNYQVKVEEPLGTHQLAPGISFNGTGNLSILTGTVNNRSLISLECLAARFVNNYAILVSERVAISYLGKLYNTSLYS